ncbi:WcaF family extracellular polysaccharide biosynthesis acetyltransferase [Maribellus mangrovi]|uniref:WcaF family extracellular polysaccharide biosynthesis acetyltransferase n=1 Tax=Maribellus mangrovi TaxID=3133146 RepID=UPI0030EEA0BE
MNIDISNKPSPHSLKVKIKRVLWAVCYTIFFRTTPGPMRRWRAFLLRLFGAKVSPKARISPSAKITMPWNLTVEDFGTIGPYAIIYSTAEIHIGKQATVSQYSYLCSATHDYEDSHFTLYAEPIVIKGQAWVSADVFVGPGVTIGEGTVVGARSSVFKDLPAWKVCVGNPAKPIKARIISRDRSHEKNPLSDK